MYRIIGFFLILVPLICVNLFVMLSRDFKDYEDIVFWVDTIVGILSTIYFLVAIIVDSWVVIPTSITMLMSCGGIMSITKGEGILSKYFNKGIDK